MSPCADRGARVSPLLPNPSSSKGTDGELGRLPHKGKPLEAVTTKDFEGGRGMPKW